METLFINIVKSSGLIAVFYIAYYLLLRKETFFTANRWFLLAGLLTSVILPWIVFTTIVWVEPTPTNIDWSKIPMTPVQEESFEIDWYLATAIAYAIGSVLLLAQFAYDFYHLNSVIKGKSVKHQADHKFIDLNENIAPFSYFNTIVYNSSLYSEQEMESILEHEKVHGEQYHTIDVLITRIFCIVFWFNPFMWLYKKAILQNLEFIADSEATKKLSDKKAYQLTLLKITTHENCVVLTNHFYQSLIKKRIVMLNKTQSKKWNSLKYALVIPVLVAFVFIFQMEVIAKEKHQNIKIEQVKSTSKDVEIYKIDKNTTEAELKEKAETISKNYGVTVHFSKTKRNASDELTSIAIEIKKGKEIAENRTVKSTDPIKAFAIIISKDENGKLKIDFAEDNESVHKEHKIVISNNLSSKNDIPDDTEIIIDDKKSDKTEMEKLDPEDIVNINVIKNSDKKEVRIITKKHSENGSEEEYFINNEKVDKDTFNQTDPKNITRMDVNTNGKKTIRIVTSNNINIQHDKNAPVPPIPPTPPVMKAKAPAPPAMPKAPKAPKGDPVHGDKKAWKEFEKQMEEFDAKMKKIEPQMEAFDKQMAEFDKQMEPFNKQMEAFNEKMKIYEKEMEKYLSEKKDKK
ncbi:M56 family metallopeptidase [Flavobacterium aquiphilum]|uniref:M56 family metallopeptidase n=1 Tax=Flavobacterium aquiphilum TaxID=3003261 RepID=UPI002480EFDF|nr:M56 family metallopeptidase [Flavobacterium aquiphilum]